MYEQSAARLLAAPLPTPHRSPGWPILWLPRPPRKRGGGVADAAWQLLLAAADSTRCMVCPWRRDLSWFFFFASGATLDAALVFARGGSRRVALARRLQLGRCPQRLFPGGERDWVGGGGGRGGRWAAGRPDRPPAVPGPTLRPPPTPAPQLSHDGGLALGGGPCFALTLDAALARGRSGHSLTFGCPCLASDHEFEVGRVEVWALR